MKKVAVVIPIYKTSLSETEEISLRQAFHVLGNHDIYLTMPDNLSIVLPYTFEKKFFASTYFESITAYNRLMLNTLFYEAFIDYEYILIYQLDAFVFCDKLLDFCELGYDYIGAPWVCGVYNFLDDQHCIWKVGNGGFSLRNVKGCLQILNEKKTQAESHKQNEDLFFSMVVSEKFKVAPMEIALRFAFEREVEKCYELNGEKLPFGCHAWERYNLAFWKPFIEQYGYNIEIDLKNKGNEDAILCSTYEECYRRSNFFSERYSKENLKKALKYFFRDKESKWVIFGAGFWGKEVLKWMQDAGLPIKYFCDNNKQLENEFVDGYRIISFKELISLRGEVNIIVAMKKNREVVKKQLIEFGFVYGKDFIDYDEIIHVINEGV